MKIYIAFTLINTDQIRYVSKRLISHMSAKFCDAPRSLETD